MLPSITPFVVFYGAYFDASFLRLSTTVSMDLAPGVEDDNTSVISAS